MADNSHSKPVKGKRSGKGKGGGNYPGKRPPEKEACARKDQGNPIDLSKCEGIEFIEVDGSVLEGGGQILRNAVAYCCLLCKPIHIVKIRMGRSNPGLKPQHLTGIRLMCEICSGTVMGDKVGSTEIYFIPGEIKGGEYTADTHTAGSVCLMLQAALPCLLLAPSPSRLTLMGGTNAEMAPPIDYILQVLQPVLAQFGIGFDCVVIKRGFYPKGGGEVRVAIDPLPKINPILLTNRGKLEDLTIECYATKEIPNHVIPRMMASACDVLERADTEGARITRRELSLGKHNSIGNGCGLNCVAVTTTGCYFGGNAIGKPGLPSEEVGRRGGEMLIDAISSGACVDEHLQDQLIVFMTLATGVSEILCGSLTLHTETAIFVAETITGVKFHRRQKDGCTVSMISCEGIGPLMRRR